MNSIQFSYSSLLNDGDTPESAKHTAIIIPSKHYSVMREYLIDYSDIMDIQMSRQYYGKLPDFSGIAKIQIRP